MFLYIVIVKVYRNSQKKEARSGGHCAQQIVFHPKKTPPVSKKIAKVVLPGFVNDAACASTSMLILTNSLEKNGSSNQKGIL